MILGLLLYHIGGMPRHEWMCTLRVGVGLTRFLEHPCLPQVYAASESKGMLLSLCLHTPSSTAEEICPAADDI
jgi:hypothetical protein